MTSGKPVGRRAFLGLAAAAGAAVAAQPLLAGTSVASPAERWRLSTWQPLQGSSLRIRGGGSIRIVEVVDRRRPTEQGDVFTLVLEPSRHALPDLGVPLELSHPALGSFALALSPVGRGSRLQAAVDQRRPSARPKEN